ncbi:GAF domain-containing protein, partial [bacterium]|nr:GAF domain-containing protein [bacterium]
IARDLASTLDLDTLLYRIVKVAAEIANAEEASILLYDDVMRQLHFQVATNMEANMRGVAVPLEGSIAGWILTNRKPVRIGDVQDDDRYFPGVENAT